VKKLLGVLFGLLLVSAYCVYVTQQLYAWFLQPFGLPSITFIHMLGLLLLVDALRTLPKRDQADTTHEDRVVSMWAGFFKYALLHLIGFVAYTLIS